MPITSFLVQGLCWVPEAPEMCTAWNVVRAGTAAGEDTGEEARDRL